MTTTALEVGPAASLSDRARRWLLDLALPAWARFGVTATGRFHEGLGPDGRPELTIPRRTRTQARQIVAFRQAARLGWTGASDIVSLAFDRLLADCRGPQTGSWIETIDADDRPIDARPDLYTHACVLLALAEMQGIGDPRALPAALETLDFIAAAMGDSICGGWLESVPARLPRRQNPHMHLLEAMLAWMEVSDLNVFGEMAGQTLSLFATTFLADDILREHFNTDWTPDADQGEILEPGHHAEWICLLHQAELNGLGGYAKVRERLYARLILQVAPNGWAVNSVSSDGRVIDGRRRLWAQCETLRAHLAMSDGAAATRLAEAIFDTHLAARTPGLWIDAFRSDGTAIEGLVPGSSFYHLTGALAALSESGV